MCIYNALLFVTLILPHDFLISTVTFPLAFALLPIVPVAQFAFRLRCLRARDACSELSDFSTICCINQPQLP